MLSLCIHAKVTAIIMQGICNINRFLLMFFIGVTDYWLLESNYYMYCYQNGQYFVEVFNY